MKLSKVKKICMDSGEIMVKKAQTGLDVDTWIGSYGALYPVHGFSMTGQLAVKVWEIEDKKLKDMRIHDDSVDSALTHVTREELEGLPVLVDARVREDAEDPGLRHMATVSKYMILQNRETGKVRVLSEKYMEPIEGTRIFYIPIDEEDMKIAVYGDGELQAVLTTLRWESNDWLVRVFEDISTVWMDSELSRKARQ